MCNRDRDQEIQNEIRRKISLEAPGPLGPLRKKSLPRLEVDPERESVEGLDSWSLKKGAATSRGSPEYRRKLSTKVERLASDSTVFALTRRKSTGKTLYAGADGSPKRFLSDVLRPIQNANMEYEGAVACKYGYLSGKLDRKKQEYAKILAEKNELLSNIATMRERMVRIKEADSRPPASPTGSPTGSPKSPTRSPRSPRSPARRKQQLAYVAMTRAQEEQAVQDRAKRKEEAEQLKKDLEKTKAECAQRDAQLCSMGEKVEGLKTEVDILREEQSEHFHRLLALGADTRQEGLVWIVKEIWRLGRNVNLTRLPTYLDESAVEFLFSVPASSEMVVRPPGSLSGRTERRVAQLHIEGQRRGQQSGNAKDSGGPQTVLLAASGPPESEFGYHISRSRTQTRSHRCRRHWR